MICILYLYSNACCANLCAPIAKGSKEASHPMKRKRVRRVSGRRGLVEERKRHRERVSTQTLVSVRTSNAIVLWQINCAVCRAETSEYAPLELMDFFWFEIQIEHRNSEKRKMHSIRTNAMHNFRIWFYRSRASDYISGWTDNFPPNGYCFCFVYII